MRTAETTNLVAMMIAATLASGCVAHAHGYAGARAEPAVVYYEEEPPTLVEIEPTVWVVQRYRTPIYYVDDSYWCYDAGVWYRASVWGEAWVRVNVDVVPRIVFYQDHRRYVNYDGPPGARVRRGPAAHAAARHGGPPGHRRGGSPGYNGYEDRPGPRRHERHEHP